MRVLSFLNFTLLAIFIQKSDSDPRLVGRWRFLYHLDPTGEVIKDEFYGKNYVQTYYSDGKFIQDPQMFRDADRRHGIKTPFDYSDIPVLEWKTTNNQLLTLMHAMGTQGSRYGFAGDTLIIGYPNGHTSHHLRVK
jgi:hypothetical protein